MSVDDDFDPLGDMPPPRQAPPGNPRSFRRERPAREVREVRSALSTRDLPHDIDAEEYLVACILIDSEDMLRRCDEARLTPQSYYFPTPRAIFEAVLRVRDAKQVVDVVTVGMDLRPKLLPREWAEFTRISGLMPTAVQGTAFIEKVRELATRREIIRASTTAIERSYNLSESIGELTDQTESLMLAACRSQEVDAGWRYTPLSDFTIPPNDDPDALLGKYRFLCRGGAIVIVGPSGIGKSSWDFQSAVCWGLGRPFLGITCTRPLKQIIVGSEDDVGDIGEVWASIAAGMKLTNAEVTQARKNVLIVEERVEVGDGFLRKLRRAVTSKQMADLDLVRINPLLAFAGCSIADQEQMGLFLRSGLNRVNAEKRFAYIITHHTNKPTKAATPGGKVPPPNWNEFLYNMSGSAELPNWARGVITLEPQKEDGKFIVRLAKRGTRAGITRKTGEAQNTVEVVTKINARHSTQKLQLPDGRTLPMIFWEEDEQAQEEKPVETPNADKVAALARARRASRYKTSEVLELFPMDEAKAEPMLRLIKKANDVLAMPKSTFMDYRLELFDAGLIAKTDFGCYYRNVPQQDVPPEGMQDEMEV